MEWSSLITTALLIILLVFLNRDRSKRDIKNEKRLSELIQSMEIIEQRAKNGKIWRDVESQRALLENRLTALWGLSELKKSFDRMSGEEYETWKFDGDEEDEIAWVQIYCRREIKKIGIRLRELDKIEASE